MTATATQTRLFEVLEAIRRIQRGRYGICEVTGQPIEPERLRVIPWARYSLKGQEELEKGGFSDRAALPELQSISEPETAPDEESDGEEALA